MINLPYQRKKEYSEFNPRHFTVLIAFILAFIVLFTALFDLQIIKGSTYANTSETRKKRILSVSGMRGKILDTNGVPLAQDETAYDIEFYREYNRKSEREMYTQSILKAITIIQANGRDVTNRFAIRINDAGEYEFYWGDVSEKTAASREDQWRKDFYFSTKAAMKMTCEEIYWEMRERYVIPEDVTDEMAFRVLGIWQDSIQSYWASKSITVVKNVDMELVTSLESYSYELSGFNVTESPLRVYPQGESASHVVGYLGRITAENVDYYVNTKKYNVNDLVGVYGVESIMEDYLTGNGADRSGQREVEVTSAGRILRELSYTAPNQGDNVYLTIDTNLQKLTEDALLENIKFNNAKQQEIYNSKLAYYKALENEAGRDGKATKFASIGAAVVMDVNSGAILALASYPGYDPALFSQGISQEDYDALLNDPNKPLFNKAISSADTPGSIFKLCISVAGLMEGAITVDEQIEDLGEFRKYVDANSKGPMCGWFRDTGKTHGFINVSEAIEYSCNYFFFEVADRLGIEKIKKWADNFGLTSKTNIELVGEAVGTVGDQATLYDASKDISAQATSIPYLVVKAIREKVSDCANKSDVKLTDDQINKIVTGCLKLVGQSRTESLASIRSILVGQYGLSKSIVDSETKFYINDYLTEITWTPTNTITTGIGQSITTVTPIAVARYVAAVVNGGHVYDAHIIKKVTDSTGKVISETAPTIFKNLDVNPAYLEAVKKGMKEMVSNAEDAFSSTARKYFSDYKYKDEMGGKTGTAQVSNINLENNAWFVAFAPYENPEIAIVVYIPNGYSGSMASGTVKAIVEYYLDQKYAVENDSVPTQNSVVE